MAVFEENQFADDTRAFSRNFCKMPQVRDYLDGRPEELSDRVSNAVYEGINEEMHRALAEELHCTPETLPNPAKYHLGNLLLKMKCEDPIYDRLIQDAVVKKHLARYDSRDILEASCSQLAWLADNEYKLHLMDQE